MLSVAAIGFLVSCTNNSKDTTTTEVEQADSSVTAIADDLPDSLTNVSPSENTEATPSKRPSAEKVKLNTDWIAGAAPKLKRWIAYQGQTIPDFSIEKFVVIDTFLEMDFPEMPPMEMDPGFEAYRIKSPDGKRSVDIYGYERKLKKKKDGKVAIMGGSPDSEAAVYGFSPNGRTRVLFCGTPCHFDDAVWLDNNIILIAGYSNEINQQFHPMLWRIDLKNQSIWRYMYPDKLPDTNKSYVSNIVFPQ